jgi:hypothetical protein
VKYELLLQPSEPSAPFDPAPLEAALSARGLTGNPEDARIWRLKAGDVELRPLLDGGKRVGTEVRVPLSDRLELIREAVLEGVVLAEQSGLRLVDPQLSRVLTAKDEGAVADQYFRTAKYAGEMLGVSEALYASIPPHPEGLKPGTKVLLGIIGLFALIFIVLELLH